MTRAERVRRLVWCPLDCWDRRQHRRVWLACGKALIDRGLGMASRRRCPRAEVGCVFGAMRIWCAVWSAVDLTHRQKYPSFRVQCLIGDAYAPYLLERNLRPLVPQLELRSADGDAAVLILGWQRFVEGRGSEGEG